MSTLLVTSWVPEEILSAGKNLKVICNLTGCCFMEKHWGF